MKGTPVTTNQLTTVTPPAAIANVASNKQYLDTTKYNPVFYTNAVMDRLPAGVEMHPYTLEIPARDLWTKDKAGFLKQGQAMLSANAVGRIAQAAGVTLKRVTDEVIKTDNGQVLRIEYEAKMILPDGTILSEVAGKEETYTPGKDHSREKTDTKARRNALRRLLGLSVTMDEADFKKPMVIWKTVFKRGGEMDHIVDAQEASSRNAVKQLYGGTDIIEGDFVTVEPHDVVAELRDMIHTAQTPEELLSAGKAVKDAVISGHDREELANEYKARTEMLAAQPAK